ncbi:MAG: N-acetyl sugar amidotransferase [Candidatus Omnitrophica bacterium]|nr:N-acetyl sugar amidotransferase [Candidatus Omnitrophota bacterium]
MSNEVLEVKYGLPKEVVYCKRCVLSNQNPNSTRELSYSPDSKKESTWVDGDGICDACKYADMKEQYINWEERKKMLQELCDKHRSKDGSYDCIVPGSGGKDSRFVSHLLKYKYGMNPLTVTWPPNMYTDIGRENFESWVRDHDNISLKPNQATHRLLTRFAFEKLVHPFQPFIIGQKLIAPKIAIKYKIPLIFYGETLTEYGVRMKDDINLRPSMPLHYYCGEHDFDNIFLGGVSVRELIEKHGVDRRDLNQYLPITPDEVKAFPLEYHFIGYYYKYHPHDVYYYAVNETRFKPNPERTEGTYSKYASLDDRIDGFHYYTAFIKFGLGRATFDAALEARNKIITREEAVSLVRKFDGEFPKRYFKDVLEYMGISEERFWQVIDNARSPHMWKKENGQWKLRHQVS